MIAWVALAVAAIALALAYATARVVDRLIRDLRDDALDDYWTALTDDQERDAYARARKYGLKASYGEPDGPS